MRKIWLALVGGAVIIPARAMAQSSEIECAKMSGGIQIITSDPRGSSGGISLATCSPQDSTIALPAGGSRTSAVC
jgi:hypothetical protein